MNFDKLYDILGETTAEFRKGEAIEKRTAGTGFDVVEIYDMPHESEAGGLEMVDVEFEVIGVDKAKAEARRADLIEILDAWPEDLSQGPSYIAVGGTMGSQSGAFRLFALGAVLGLWKVVTPGGLGITGETAREMAGTGFIMITGYRPKVGA